jgi:hypothetical protein
MRTFLLVGFFGVWATIVEASHIVGGEMALVHVPGSPYTYRLELILYYDFKNGLTGGDPTISVRIFRKRDHQVMPSTAAPLTLILTTVTTVGTPVEYFQPDCSDQSIETNRVFYQSAVITLSPDIYNDPLGYYLAWERCCRNYVITNIYSESPDAGASYNRIAGQIFYLEIPPVVKDGEPFINSSPRLFPPLSDYACPQRGYFVEFAGTDPDGDSLVYSMVTPINSRERFFALPPGGVPNPGPYDSVSWKPGFSLTNIMNGNPDLTISNDGLLTVKPSTISIGLYVFAVRCEEFREGVKIGEVRRDFQLLVQDACPVAEPPVIVGRKKGELVFSMPNQSLSLSFANTVSDADRCVQVQLSDPDSEKFDDNFQERVSVKVIPLNFKTANRFIKEVLPTVSDATLVNGSVATFDICLPQCPYLPTGNYQIGIIAFDDACTLPLSDTLRLTVFVEPPPNNEPAFTTGNADFTLNEGDPALTIPIHAVDADVDQLDVFVITDGFILENVGMSLALDAALLGVVDGQLVWDTRCDVFDFTQKTNFNFKIIVDDRDLCLFAHPDTMTIALKIILPGNSDPVINSTLPSDPNMVIEVTRKIYETLEFDVSGTDADNDLLVLGVKGIGFIPQEYGAGFPGVVERGTVLSSFSWPLDCAVINLEEKDEFEFQFIVVDNANKCRLYKADTLDVIVHVEPPDNFDPELLITSQNPDQPLVNNSLTALPGSTITLSLSGYDADLAPSKDNLTLELIGQTGNVQPSGFEFENVQGPSVLTAAFTWQPDCSIFENFIYENQYTFTFRLSDDRCFNVKADTVEVNMTIRDADGSDDGFLPPNFFSPNSSDDLNSFFAMARWDEASGEFVNILPLDNCVGRFLSIRIYNRWGRQVFESVNRDFRWYGEGMPNGVYYYLVEYTNAEYRGTITLRY